MEIDRKTCDFLVYAEKEIVATHEEVEDDCLRIALEDALEISRGAKGGKRCHPCGNQVQGIWTYRHPERENVILQKIREEERSVIYNQYFEKKKMWLPA